MGVCGVIDYKSEGQLPAEMIGSSLATAPIVDVILTVVQEYLTDRIQAVVYANNIRVVDSPWQAGLDTSGSDDATFFESTGTTSHCYGIGMQTYGV